MKKTNEDFLISFFDYLLKIFEKKKTIITDHFYFFNFYHCLEVNSLKFFSIVS